MSDSFSLLCQESESCLNEDEEEEEDEDEEEDEEEDEDRLFSLTHSGFSDTEDEYIKILVSKEESFGTKCSDDFFEDQWLKCARLDAVRWILKTRVSLGFCCQTAYLSITYLDRFLSRRLIEKGKSWAFRLLSVACLSLAAKLEECKVPLLSNFRVEDYEFDSKVIQRMELLVLSTLEWRMASVTPFAYMKYFVVKLDNELRPKGLFSRSIKLILAAAEETNLIERRPYAIAIASVLAASDQRLTKKSLDVKMDASLPCGSFDKDHVFSCYTLVWELRVKQPKIVISSDLSTAYSSSVVDLPGDTSITSVASKRRKLFMSDEKQ